jgi:glycosyltransferase involved in cell wall biosynthesis
MVESGDSREMSGRLRFMVVQEIPFKRISIVSPCFNEEDNVRTCYDTVKALFETQLSNCEREHIFADNASTDRTVEILRELAARDFDIKVVVNSRNFGLFRSTFNALRYASGDATLVMLPVDLQDPPELLPKFVRLWKQGYDVVAGARIERQEGLLMRSARRLFYAIVNRLSGFEIPENVGEFQLIDRKVLDAVLKHQDHYPYIRGIIAACGFNRVIVPYAWKARVRGYSKINLFELFDQALNGIFSFTAAPLRVCIFLGFALAMLCFLYAVVTTFAYIFMPHVAPRGIASLVVGLFFLVGVQLIFIGVLGEYVTSIHSQVRRGPLVIERERINLPEPELSQHQG